MIKTRICLTCGEIKPLTEFYFNKKRGIPTSKCRSCTSIYNAKRYDPAKARAKYQESIKNV